MNQPRRYVFGPVPSRRLGRSLGIDLVPAKTCAFDCVYCQLGGTNARTANRRPYVVLEQVIEELDAALEADPAPDFITLSGSGEPTLHRELDACIAAIRERTAVPIAILTSGALLFRASVRAACAQADVILPTLAAHNDRLYSRIHRPVEGIGFQTHFEGLVAVSTESQARLWLELFLLEGLNASDADLRAFTAVIDAIRPDKIQLNTVVRPPSSPSALSVSPDKLDDWAVKLGPKAEVIAEHTVLPPCQAHPDELDLLALFRRHPCRLEELTQTSGLDPQQVRESLERLRAAGLVISHWHDGREYFVARD